MLGDASTSPAQDAKRPGLVQNDPESVLVAKLDLPPLIKQEHSILVECTYDLGQINHISHIFEQSLRNNKSPCQRLLRLLYHDLCQHSLQILHIIVFVPSNRAS